MFGLTNLWVCVCFFFSFNIVKIGTRRFLVFKLCMNNYVGIVFETLFSIVGIFPKQFNTHCCQLCFQGLRGKTIEYRRQFVYSWPETCVRWLSKLSNCKYSSIENDAGIEIERTRCGAAVRLGPRRYAVLVRPVRSVHDVAISLSIGRIETYCLHITFPVTRQYIYIYIHNNFAAQWVR